MFQFVEKIKKDINKRQLKKEQLEHEINSKYQEMESIKKELSVKEKEYGQTLNDSLLSEINATRDKLGELTKQHDRLKDNLNLIQENKSTCDTESVIQEIKEVIKNKQFDKKRESVLKAADDYMDQLNKYAETLHNFYYETQELNKIQDDIDDKTLKAILELFRESFSNLDIDNIAISKSKSKSWTEENCVVSTRNYASLLRNFE